MLLTPEKTDDIALSCLLFYRFFVGEPSLPLWQDFQQIQQMEWFMSDATPQELSTFQHLQASLNTPLEQIIADYNQLFIGPDILKAAPWASVYLSEDGQIFGEENLNVKGFYNKYKMDMPSKLNEPVDHIAFEFQFIHLILQHYAEADAKVKAFILRDLKDFLQHHFLPWAPLFLEKVKQYAQTDFYKDMALLALFTTQRLSQIPTPEEL